MNTVRQIGSICDIKPGFQFRGRVEPMEAGEYQVLQMKDVEQDFSGAKLGWDRMTITVDYGFQEKHFAQHNDVIFCSRGNNNFSLLLCNPPEKMVISALFFILRCNENTLLPGYLWWFLNSSKVQRELSGIRCGTTTQIVTTRALSEIEIPVPDLKTQQLTAETYHLQIRERELLSKIQKKQDEFIETQLFMKAEGQEL